MIDQIGPEAWREEHEHAARRLEAEGVPAALARRHAFQAELVHGPDIITVAHATGRTVLEVARAFFLLGERLELDWLENQLEAMPGGSRWQRWALQSMEDDLFTLRRSLGRSGARRVRRRCRSTRRWRSSSSRATTPSRACSGSCAASRSTAWATSRSSPWRCGRSGR